MQVNWRRGLAAAGLAALLGGAALAAPGLKTARLSPEEFQRWHRAVQPGAERWAEIPWETDLEQARQRGAREGKPLLMWIMDGHPLGCT